MPRVDINCDIGEGCGNDAELMSYVTSANIACGFHAGDDETMRRTVELAIENDVHIGAHPGYNDRANFGRTRMSLTRDEIRRVVTDQIGALERICTQAGTKLHHVKPHGALYNQAARDPALADAIAHAVAKFDAGLTLYGLSGSMLIVAAESVGLKTASEVFADRTYRADGSLTPRNEPNALIGDVDQAVEQVLQMVREQTVKASTGETIPIRAETVCIHGDGEHAVEFAKAISAALKNAGVTEM